MPIEFNYLLFLFGIVVVFGALVFLIWYLILKWSGKLKPRKSKKKDKKTKD